MTDLRVRLQGAIRQEARRLFGSPDGSDAGPQVAEFVQALGHGAVTTHGPSDRELVSLIGSDLLRGATVSSPYLILDMAKMRKLALDTAWEGLSVAAVTEYLALPGALRIALFVARVAGRMSDAVVQQIGVLDAAVIWGLWVTPGTWFSADDVHRITCEVLLREGRAEPSAEDTTEALNRLTGLRVLAVSKDSPSQWRVVDEVVLRSL